MVVSLRDEGCFWFFRRKMFFVCVKTASMYGNSSMTPFHLREFHHSWNLKEIWFFSSNFWRECYKKLHMTWCINHTGISLHNNHHLKCENTNLLFKKITFIMLLELMAKCATTFGHVPDGWPIDILIPWDHNPFSDTLIHTYNVYAITTIWK